MGPNLPMVSGSLERASEVTARRRLGGGGHAVAPLPGLPPRQAAPTGTPMGRTSAKATDHAAPQQRLWAVSMQLFAQELLAGPRRWSQALTS